MKVGKIAQNIWKRSITKALPYHNMENEGIGIGRNVAGLGQFLITEDIIIPNTKKMGMIGVCLAVNEIAGQMGKPEAVKCSLYLDGRSSEEFAGHIAKDAGSTSKRLGIPITSFDVHILHGLKTPYLSTSAIGLSRYSFENDIDKAGIIQVGTVGNAGVSMILGDAGMKEKLFSRYPQKYILNAGGLADNLAVSNFSELLKNEKLAYSICIGEEGIDGALWNMSYRLGCGIKVDLKNVLISQETVEICNFYNINPYKLYSGDSFLLVAKEAEKIAGLLEENGYVCSVIGTISDNNDKIYVNDEEVRYITKPSTDAIYELF